MDFYLSAKEWDEKIPSTKAEASPQEPLMVHNVIVIKVTKASYRKSVFDGVFLLAPETKLPLPKEGKHRVEVFCRWFGCRLKTKGPKLLVDMRRAEVIENYSGEVFTNFTNKYQKK